MLPSRQWIIVTGSANSAVLDSRPHQKMTHQFQDNITWLWSTQNCLFIYMDTCVPLCKSCHLCLGALGGWKMMTQAGASKTWVLGSNSGPLKAQQLLTTDISQLQHSFSPWKQVSFQTAFVKSLQSQQHLSHLHVHCWGWQHKIIQACLIKPKKWLAESNHILSG